MPKKKTSTAKRTAIARVPQPAAAPVKKTPAKSVLYAAVRCAGGSVVVMGFIEHDGLGNFYPITAAWVSALIAKSAEPQPDVGYKGWDDPPMKNRRGECLWRFIDRETDLPAGWEQSPYRNALTDDGKTISHRMEHAREIHRDQLRRRRAPLLAELDQQQLRAYGARDTETAAALEREKQALRDVTAHPKIAKAKTVADLALSDIATLTGGD